jgi:integral membrane sensor domain MASE1
MKQVKGLGGWIRSAIWLELIIPGYFFGKTFGTADAKFRFLDTFMYPPLFITICGYFRDLPAGYYAGRFCGVLAGAVIGVLCALLIGVFYKWVLKDWAYSKAARLGSLAFILVALLTGFMSDMFNESIGMALRIEEKAPDELVGKFLVQDYGSFTKGTLITEQNAGLLAAYGTVRANNEANAKSWWIASIIFIYVWFGLYLLCAQRFFKRNLVPREAYFKLQTINVTVFIIYLRMGFGISPSEYHYIVTRFQYLFGGGM